MLKHRVAGLQTESYSNDENLSYGSKYGGVAANAPLQSNLHRILGVRPYWVS